jgi:hypothetical protein
VIAGTPTQTGSFAFTVRVTDARGQSDDQAFTMEVLPAGTIINVALEANGGVASASSVFNSTTWPLAALNNGDRKGLNWNNGGLWADGTPDAWPDWAQITFAGNRTISKIDVTTQQDNYVSPVEPTETLTFSNHGIRAFEVQYWNGSGWVTVPGGSVVGNTKVWRSFTFPAVTTDRIRVWVTNSGNIYSRIAELEAWGTAVGGNVAPTVSLTAPDNNATYTAPAAVTLAANASDSDGTVARVELYSDTNLLGTATTPPYSFAWTNVSAGSYVLTAKAYDNAGASTVSSPVAITVTPAGAPLINVALQANGGVASASSVFNSTIWPLAAINNGDRKGLNWNNGGLWADGTPDAWPDWAQITFAGNRTISKIDVFTMQDNYLNPIEPTAALTFATTPPASHPYAGGITDFYVQYWNGSGWITVPGGSVTGNNNIWRNFTFPAVTTDCIRILINHALNKYSRVAEIEAWGTN